MRRSCPSLAVVMCGVVLGFSARAADALAGAVPAGTPLVAGGLSAFKPGGPPDVLTASIVDAAGGHGFNQAYRIELLKGAPSPWGAVLRCPTDVAVQKGDVLWLGFWMRGLASKAESGEAYATAVFEEIGGQSRKSLSQRCGAGKEWKHYQLPFTASDSYAPGKAQVIFHLAHGVQALEIAGVEARHYGKAAAMRDLPRTRFSYRGREPEAAWRKAALERIERLRKGDLAVEVVDAAGKPVPEAEVSVRMTRHAFPFGSAVAADLILSQSPDGEQYRQHIKRLFNRVVMENDLKWGPWEGRRERSIAGVDWLRAQGIQVRGHNLIWPGWRNMPRGLQALEKDPAALRKRINDHILDEASAMKGKLVEWDVINEPYSNKDVMKVLGDAEMIEWFKLARQADPAVVLFLNDYPILRGTPEPHLDHFEKTIRLLKDGGAPIGGIGVQGHYGSNVPPPEQVLAGLDRLAKFGLPIAITELDVNTDDEDLQADYLRDHLIACFSHEAVNSVLQWGFWEGRHWLPKAALYRRDWTVKPNGKAFEDLVFKGWWTDVKVKADDRGVARVRGFLGDYQVAAGEKTATAKLTREGARVRVGG